MFHVQPWPGCVPEIVQKKNELGADTEAGSARGLTEILGTPAVLVRFFSTFFWEIEYSLFRV